MTNDLLTHTLSILATNTPGVLLRIAIVFARRSVNIDSLVVASLIGEELSRMTITAKGDASSMEQIVKQIRKLIDVIEVSDLVDDNAVERELAMVKVKTSSKDRQEILQIVEHFKAKTIDLTENTLVIEVCGNSEKIDAFFQLIQTHPVLEMSRSGKMIMQRGES